MSKTHKTLDIFYRALKGEAISPKVLKVEYDVSDRTVTRHINEVKSFLAKQTSLKAWRKNMALQHLFSALACMTK